MTRTSNKIILRKASALILFLLLPAMAAAEPLTPIIDIDYDQVLVNSKDWRDVFHGLLFAQLTGKPGDFILSPDIADDVVLSLDKEKPRVLVVEQRRQEQYANLDRLLLDNGFTPVSLPGAGPNGLRMAAALPLRGIIVTDERYPYNAVSLAPYAILRQEFVLFADATTIEETVSVIDDQGVPVTIYGLVDAAVRGALQPYSPLIIDEGGKFDNNLYVVKAFFEQQEGEQVVITNGEFLEQSLVDDFNPVLFLGKQNVPAQVDQYLASSLVTHGVVVGNYLAETASDLKSRLKSRYDKDIFLVVKFGRSPRVLESQFSIPAGLEYFPLPLLEPSLSIVAVSYNRLSSILEVTYENPSRIPVFFTSSFTLSSGGESITAGDEDVVSIVPGQQKTVLYDAPISPEGLAASGITIYGDYPESFEYSFSSEFTTIPIISMADDSQITIDDILYDKSDKAFYVTLRNPGTVPAYVNVELVDVIVDGLPTTLGTARTALVQPGESKEVYIRAKLSDLDILENEEVLVRAFYGARELVLFKVVEGAFPLRTRLFKPAYILGAAALAIIVLLLLFMLFGRKRVFVCDRCGERVSSRQKPGRHACGGRFR